MSDKPEGIRLQKVLAAAGVASRRVCEEMIVAGSVKVNGKVVTELYTDSETGAIHYGTTSLLLEQLGINSLDQLPPISPYLPDINSDFNER